jgi:hypothetical protein
MNLEGHTAIGLTIRGDGSNAILVIRLEDSEGECRNFIVENINWTGWRNVTVNVPQARRLFDFPLIRKSTAMRYYRWSSIISMSIAVTNALSASIGISSIVARQELPAVLSGATVQAGGKSFAIPDGLNAHPCSAAACEWTGLGCFPTPNVASCNEYAECSQSGCHSFDANNGNISRTVGVLDRARALEAQAPGLRAGADIEVRFDGPSRGARAEITVIEQSDEVMGPFPLHKNDTE